MRAAALTDHPGIMEDRVARPAAAPAVRGPAEPVRTPAFETGPLARPKQADDPATTTAPPPTMAA